MGERVGVRRAGVETTNQVISFGGNTSGVAYGDTATYNGVDWVQHHPATVAAGAHRQWGAGSVAKLYNDWEPTLIFRSPLAMQRDEQPGRNQIS